MSKFWKKYGFLILLVAIVLACASAVLLSNGYSTVARAYIRLQFKDYKNAIKDLDTAIQNGINDATYYTARGVAKYEISDNIGALDDFNTAIKKGFNQAAHPHTERNTYYFRGLVYLDLGKDCEALEDVETTIRMGRTDMIEIRNELQKHCANNKEQ